MSGKYAKKHNEKLILVQLLDNQKDLINNSVKDYITFLEEKDEAKRREEYNKKRKASKEKRELKKLEELKNKYEK